MLERIDVVASRPRTVVEYEHHARYLWAMREISAGEILDAACGTGHGSELLALRGQVSGVDRDDAAVERAASRTAGRFIVADIPPLPFPDASFDWAVSFETIEHLADDDGFLSEVRRVLRPGGKLLISTPNKELTSPDGRPSNQFHVREYTLGGLSELLSRHAFAVEGLFAQRIEPRSATHRLARRAAWHLPLLGRLGRRLQSLLYGRVLDLDVHPARDGDRPLYWILRCRLEVRNP